MPAHPADVSAAQLVAERLKLLAEHVPVQKRTVHAGQVLYRASERFDCLHVLNCGLFKTVDLASDGREQVVGLHFRGDWLGFDGIAAGRYGCDAIAMDTGEVWTIRYDALLAAGARHPELMRALHEAMSREIARDRDAMMSLNTLPADARVAEFLRWWADALSQRGLRTDHITLPLTRAEIGNYLGMTLESVSRALSRLARGNVIRFPEKGRRDIQIPEVGALAAFVRTSTSPAAMLQ